MACSWGAPANANAQHRYNAGRRHAILARCLQRWEGLTPRTGYGDTPRVVAGEAMADVAPADEERVVVERPVPERRRDPHRALNRRYGPTHIAFLAVSGLGGWAMLVACTLLPGGLWLP